VLDGWIVTVGSRCFRLSVGGLLVNMFRSWSVSDVDMCWLALEDGWAKQRGNALITPTVGIVIEVVDNLVHHTYPCSHFQMVLIQ